MSHAHRKNSVTVPLGGLNATNQNFAKSLRFNNKSENEKDEWHDQLLAEDSNATVNSKNERLTASQLRRAELMKMRQSLRRGGDNGSFDSGGNGGNLNADDLARNVTLDDGSSLQVSEVINLYRKNQERLVKSNKQVVKTLKKLEGKMQGQGSLLSQIQTPSFQTPGVVDVEQLRQMQQYEIEVNLANNNNYNNNNSNHPARGGSFDDSSSTAIVTRHSNNNNTNRTNTNNNSIAGSMQSFKLNSPVLRAHERIIEEQDGDWTIDASHQEHQYRSRNGSRPSSPKRGGSKSRKKVWMPPSPGRSYNKRRGDVNSDLGSSNLKQTLSSIKIQQKRNNQLLRLLSDGANQAKPETMELLALAENNAVLAKHIEDSVESKARVEFELRLEQERSREIDMQFAEMVDICKEEEKGRKLAEEKARGLEDELKRLERSNLKHLGNSQRESNNTKILKRKIDGLEITNEKLQQQVVDWKANAEGTSKKMSIMAEELQELRSQVGSLRSENEYLSTKADTTSKTNGEYEEEIKTLKQQVYNAHQEMNQLASLQASINKVNQGNNFSIEKLKHFSREQEKIEEIALEQKEEIKSAKKEIQRLNNIISEERKLTSDLNDTADEARKALIEMDRKIKSDQNMIENLKFEIQKNIKNQKQMMEKHVEEKNTLEKDKSKLERHLVDAQRRQKKAQSAVSSINAANMALREQIVEMENRLNESKRAHHNLLNTLNDL